MQDKIYISKAFQEERLSLESIAQKCFPKDSQYLAFPNKDTHVLAIRDIEKGIVGYVVYSDEEKSITDMAVLPEYRRDKNGSSKKLLDSMMNHIAEEGGRWEADLTDDSTLVYVLMQAKRGVAKITKFGDSPFYTMSNGNNVYSTEFEYVPIKNRQHIRKKNEPFIKMMEKIVVDKKEAEKKFADLLLTISNALEENGYSPEIRKDSIVFEYEGDGFQVLFNKQRLNHFGVAYHIYSFEEQDEYAILKIANDFNCNLDYSRIVVIGNHCYARMGMGMNLQESPLNIVNNIFRISNMILSTKRDFRKRMEKTDDLPS